MATAAIAMAIFGATAAVASTVISLRQMNKAKNQRKSYTYGEGALMTSTSNMTPVPIIYGEVKVAGNQIYSRLTNSDKTIYKLVVLCEGPVEEIKDFKIDDRAWNSSKYEGVSYSAYLGGKDEPIDSRVVKTFEQAKGESDEDFEYRKKNMTDNQSRAWRVGGLKRLAYIAMKADANENLSGSFSISALVKGSKVNVYTTPEYFENKYSNNPAWCILDFMTRYNGCGMSVDEIDIQSFIDAAKYFDDNDYTLNLCLDEQKSRLDWINDMMDCCRSNLVYKAGKYAIQVEKAEQVVQTYRPEDIHDLQVWFSPMEEVPDIYRLTYISPDDEWAKIQAEASNPPSTYIRKQPMVAELTLMGVTNFSQASRLAWFYLNQALTCQTYIEFKTDRRALNRTVGDVIEVTDYVTEFQNKKFRIIKIEDTQDEAIKLTCREYNEDIYIEKESASLPVINRTKLDFSLDVPPPINYVSNTQEYWVNQDGSITSNIVIAVDYLDFIYNSYYKVSCRKVGEENWMFVGNYDAGIKSITIPNMEVFATYEFRFQNVSRASLVSEFTYSPQIYIKGSSTTPNAPSNFKAKRTYGGIKLTWDRLNNMTYQVYEVVGDEQLLIETFEEEYIYFADSGNHEFKLYAINKLGYKSPASTASFDLQRPRATNIAVANKYREVVDGVSRYDLLVKWTPPEGAYYKRAEVWYKTSNEQLEYMALDNLTELNVPLDELNLYKGDWISAGYGTDCVIISQAVVGDKYLIAVCVQDEYGGTDNPDNCPQIEHTVTLKADIPNTPDKLMVKFERECIISWEEVRNSDILYYEIRRDTNFGDERNLIVKTTETATSIPVGNRLETIYVYAVSTSLKKSSPAILTIKKDVPPKPVISASSSSIGVLALTNTDIPSGCFAIHYEVTGTHASGTGGSALHTYSVDFESSTNLLNVEADVYTIKACFVDCFGRGDYSDTIYCTVNPWIDGELLKKGSITKDALDDVTNSALGLAESAVQEAELKTSIENAKKYADGIIGDLGVEINENLKNYVKQETLDGQIKTTMANVGVLDGNKTLNVYKKSEFADQVQTVLLAKDLTNEKGETNVYTISQFPTQVNTLMESYTSNTLDSRYASYATEQTVTSQGVAISNLGTAIGKDSNGNLVSVSSQVSTALNTASGVMDTKLSAYDTNTVKKTYATIANLNDTNASVSTIVKTLNKESGTTQYSAITQLDNAIGLKVDKNGIIGAINLSNETATIDTKFLHITGKTLIDNDVITKGMIQAGAIDATKLSADTLVLTNKQGISGGACVLNADGMTVTNSSGGYIKFSNEGMNFFDSVGQRYAGVGRLIIGSARHGQVVNLNSGWAGSNMSITVIPQNLQTSVGGYTTSDIKIVCGYQMVSPTSFKVLCGTYLLNASTGMQSSGLVLYNTTGFDFQAFTNNSNNYLQELQLASVPISLPASPKNLTINVRVVYESVPTKTSYGSATDAKFNPHIYIKNASGTILAQSRRLAGGYNDYPDKYASLGVDKTVSLTANVTGLSQVYVVCSGNFGGNEINKNRPRITYTLVSKLVDGNASNDTPVYEGDAAFIVTDGATSAYSIS